jgi:quercetin dioxygenase-like cupin family protein
MKTISKLLVGTTACAAATVAAYSIAQDRVAVVAGMKVLLDNDCVRVQYHDVAVGQTVPMHSHPSYVVYVLKSFRARITLPDGTQRISAHKEGEAYWNEPITHSVENLGNTDIHNLVIELKQSKSCH